MLNGNKQKTNNKKTFWLQFLTTTTKKVGDSETLTTCLSSFISRLRFTSSLTEEETTRPSTTTSSTSLTGKMLTHRVAAQFECM